MFLSTQYNHSAAVVPRPEELLRRTDVELGSNVVLGWSASSTSLEAATDNLFVGPAAGTGVRTGERNVIVGRYAGANDLRNHAFA